MLTNWVAKCFLLLQLVAVALVSAESEKFEFQAEVSRMMDIIINSLYQNKEVFLREVISNSADALDKIRFLSLQHPEELDSFKELEMRISYDEEEKTLTIRDSGVGMTRQELIENLGTVAKSGTTNFVEQLASSGDLSLIGQFGVGFYSVYLVSDRVQVRTKSNKDDKQYIWESTADSTFTVAEDTGESLGRGTEIKLFLKEDALEYADSYRLTYLVERYSEFISFPIYVYKEVEVEEDEEEVSDDDEEEDLGEDGDEGEDSSGSDEDEDTGPKKEWRWVQINTQKAIWTRSPSEIEDSEYIAFYKSLTKAKFDPLTWTHFRAEGEVEFKSILYIPLKAPYNQYDQYYNIDGLLKLYVRKVLIKDDFEDFLPKYLNFIRGVVDSDDLPLSVSRETLQQAKAIPVIGKKLVRKSLDMLQRMADRELPDEDEDDDDDMEDDQEEEVAKYHEFYEQFGKNLKLGLVEDTNNRDRLIKLLRYKTTKTESGEVEAAGGMSGLESYVKRMKSWQKSIYYLTGENVETLLTSPFLKKALSKDVEVLLMADPVDEYVLQHVKKFDGYDLQSLAKDGVKFGDETEDDKKIEEEYKKQFKELTKWLKNEVYNNEENGGKKDFLNRVTVTTTRIDENVPAVVVSARYGNSATMERLMMSQALGDTAKKTIAQATKIMEINPRSPIVAKLLDIYQTNVDQAKDIAWLLLDTALVTSGFDINEKPSFASRMYRLMKSGLQLDSLEPLPFIDVPEDEPEEEEAEDEFDMDAAADEEKEEL